MGIHLSILKLTSLSVAILIFISLLTISVISLIEKEKLASKRAVLMAFLFSTPYFLLYILNFPYQKIVLISAIFFTLLTFLLLIIPIKNKIINIPDKPKNQIDERDIMFSRKILSIGTKNYKEYYSKNKDKEVLDNEFRKQPGLLSEKSLMHHPLCFSSTEASFYATAAFNDFIDGKINPNKSQIKKSEITVYIKNWAQKLGAVEIGVAKLEPYHFYSYGGRQRNYGEKIVNNHKYGIVFSVEMDKQMLACAPYAPTVMESAQQYLNSAAISVQIAAFIRNLGYSAKAHIDGNYEVVCPLIGKDAGLGELGRMGLLMTQKLGPRVRLGVITTNIPLIADDYKPNFSVLDFCTICKKCADVCPSNAISFSDMNNKSGIKRWKINQEACFSYWTKTGTDCGRCVSVCPYSHPDNFFHKFIRVNLKNSALFRRFALKMDDLFYGRKPKTVKFPKWIPK